MKLSIVAFSTLVLVVFSGCIQGEATPEKNEADIPAAPPAGFDENTGGIEGIVFDDEGKPIPAVQMAVQANDASPLTTLTDATGRFSFSNLAPGTYQVFASALGYESAAKAVAVVAGESTPAQFVLVSITLVEVYHEIIAFKGFFDCTWANPTGSGNCGYIGQTNGTTGNPLEPQWVNSKRKWNYMAGPGAMSVLHDLTWTPGSFATGSKMGMTLSHGPLEDGTQRVGTHRFCAAAGFNPVQLQWTREDLEDDGECLTGTAQVGGSIPGPETIDAEKGLLLQSFVSTGVGQVPVLNQDLPVGLAYQQPFDLYVSIFYGEPFPEGFSAFADN